MNLRHSSTKRLSSPAAIVASALCAALFSVANPARAALPAGLDHHWAGEDDATDSVGSAHGTNGATTAYANGISGRGFSFDGAQSSIVTLPVNIGPSARPQMTIGFWVKMRSLANDRGWVFGHDNGGYDRSINLTDSRYGYGVAGGTGRSPHVSSLIRLKDNLDTWVCVAAAYDHATGMATFFADGESQTVLATPGEGAASASLGGLKNFLNHTVDAVVDEVFLYNRVLDADEVADACEFFSDKDGDAVVDANDLCLDTPPDVVVSDAGCSGAQEVALACGESADWPKPGQYLACVTEAAADAIAAGLLTNQERADIIRTAARGK